LADGNDDMTRRQRIARKLQDLAEAHERQAVLAVVRAQEAQQDAAVAAADLEERHATTEAEITGSGVLSGFERELLWAHRASARRERTTTQERLALTEAQVEAARRQHAARHQDVQVRERVRERVDATQRGLVATSVQREHDDLASQRWVANRLADA